MPNKKNNFLNWKKKNVLYSKIYFFSEIRTKNHFQSDLENNVLFFKMLIFFGHKRNKGLKRSHPSRMLIPFEIWAKKAFFQCDERYVDIFGNIGKKPYFQSKFKIMSFYCQTKKNNFLNWTQKNVLLLEILFFRK